MQFVCVIILKPTVPSGPLGLRLMSCFAFDTYLGVPYAGGMDVSY